MWNCLLHRFFLQLLALAFILSQRRPNRLLDSITGAYASAASLGRDRSGEQGWVGLMTVARVAVGTGSTEEQGAGGGAAAPVANAACGRNPSGSAVALGVSPDPIFHVFLLFGQSNMGGVPDPEAEDLVEQERVQVLAYDNCSTLGRSYNEWHTASPPLHSCRAGVGPGDHFAKRMIEACPNSRVGLVPCGVHGADIDFFRKDVVSSRRSEFSIPPDNHWTGAYEWMVERARLAQRSGVIRGILFHQGESDNTDPAWPGKVAGIVSDLRQDLGLVDSTPFVAGELLHSGCCAAHNARVAELLGLIPTSAVVSAKGLNGMDPYHFDLAGQRELGSRYATAMLSLLARL